MCDAAHGGSLEHVVFNKPFKVKPEYEFWSTPSEYRRYPGGDTLPENIKVWRVQDLEAKKRLSFGVVSRSWGFNDSPDAEALVAGYNLGKEHGAVGVGRHGNFLQWGFSAPPSKMTEAGRSFFLNCICYIHKFDGKGPLIRRISSDRINPVRLALILDKIKDKTFFSSSFTPEQITKYTGKPNELAKYYSDNYEFIYKDKYYLIDWELKDLGLESNRSFSTLVRLIELLDDKKHAETARRLLHRYTEESFETPGQWQGWLQKNRGHFYFSDVGGFKFRVVPQGYLDEATAPMRYKKAKDGGA